MASGGEHHFHSNSSSTSSTGYSTRHSDQMQSVSSIGSAAPTNEARLFSKRTREIQASEGVVPASIWASNGGTTASSPAPEQQHRNLNQTSRPRAGTFPSKFPHGDNAAELATELDVPKGPSAADLDSGPSLEDPYATPSPAVVSRLRSGSLNSPARNLYSGTFGPSVFSSAWAQQRFGVLQPSSPATSSFSRDDEQTPVKTLDYLGLAGTPTPPRQTVPSSAALQRQQLHSHSIQIEPSTPQQDTNNTNLRNISIAEHQTDSGLKERHDPTRIRSYSVNSKEQYTVGVGGGDDDHPGIDQEALRRNSAYASSFLSSTVPRPRASTTGILESPPTFPPPSGSASASHLAAYRGEVETQELTGLNYATYADSVQQPNIGYNNGMTDDFQSYNMMESQPTRSIWVGNIPPNTYSGTLESVFHIFGPIESARILSHKNCGFVNFNNIESAVAARSALQGKEIFPGTGPIRIGFAKVHMQGESGFGSLDSGLVDDGLPASLNGGSTLGNGLSIDLRSIEGDISYFVQQYGASVEEVALCNSLIGEATAYGEYADDIPMVSESKFERRYDAPRLRELRKRMENQLILVNDIDEVGIDMLDEIVELASGMFGDHLSAYLFFRLLGEHSRAKAF